MLAWLGLATIVTFTALVMTKKISAVAGLVLIPLIFGLIGGFGADLGQMMISGIVATAPTAAMLTFSLLFFLVVTEAGLFEPLVRKVLSIAGDDPVRIVMGTAVVITCICIAGDGSTAVFVVLSSMYAIYRRIGINPLIMAMLIALIRPTLTWLPWGGPSARMAASLRIDPWVAAMPMLPAMLLTLGVIFIFAYIAGVRERHRINAINANPDLTHDDSLTMTASAPEAPTTWRIWLNLALTIIFLVCMASKIMPLAMVSMIMFSLSVTLNWPNLKTQTEKLKPHAQTVVTVVSLILAAGAFTGIMMDTGMVMALANSLISIMPESWGGAFALITTVLVGPLLFVVSNDSFYFGLVPILAQAGAAYGVPPEMIAHAVLPGIYLHSISPMSAPIYLVAALLRADFGSIQRYAFPWVLAITVVAIAATILTGAVHVV